MHQFPALADSIDYLDIDTFETLLSPLLLDGPGHQRDLPRLYQAKFAGNHQ